MTALIILLEEMETTSDHKFSIVNLFFFFFFFPPQQNRPLPDVGMWDLRAAVTVLLSTN